MGLKEDMILELKGAIIEYQGKKLYVVEQIKHEENIYLFVINSEKVPNVEMNFLKKISATTYENVEDDQLFDVLLSKVGIEVAKREIEEILKDKNL